MNSSYSLDEYVRDLRTITAQETDPINIADRVAPLAKKFAQTPGWMRPEYRECDAEQGFGVHCCTKSLTTTLRFLCFLGCLTAARLHTTTRLGAW